MRFEIRRWVLCENSSAVLLLYYYIFIYIVVIINDDYYALFIKAQHEGKIIGGVVYKKKVQTKQSCVLALNKW